MTLIEQLTNTIKGLKADQIKAAQAHDWAEFDKLQAMIDSTKRYRAEWEAKQYAKSA